MNFIGNLVPFRGEKIENQLKFDDVTTMSLVAPFLEHACVLSFCVI